MLARLQVQAGALGGGDHVVNGERQAHVDPADVVDHLFEAAEVQLDDVIEVDPGLLFNGLAYALRTPRCQRGVDPFGGIWIGLLSWRALPRRTGVERDDRVAGDADHGDVAATGRDMRDHDRVRAGAAIRAADPGVAPGPGIGAEQQEVQRVVVPRRPLARVDPAHVRDTGEL